MNRNTIFLVALLVVLGIAAFLVLQRPGEMSLPESGGELLLGIDSANVTSIRIASDGATISMSKRGNEWVIEGEREYKADPVAVGTLLKEAANLSVRSVISTKPEKHQVFEVDTSGTRITFGMSAGEPVTCIIGKSAPGFTEVYARREGSNDVVLVHAAISYSSRRSLTEWRDRTIVRVPKDQIREIDFAYGDTTFTVAWKDSLWTVDGEPAQEWAVNSLVSALSDLKADEFLDTAPVALRKPTATITFAGTSLRFFLPRGSDKYIVHSSASPQWYQLESWRSGQVLKRKKDLLLPR
ncbi:MAG: DUF4340 domain-containing protein [Ignavibacterium sp.]|jgi:hypothetical protein